MLGKKIIGIEAERIRLKGRTLKAIQKIMDIPQRRRSAGDRRGYLAPPEISAFKNVDIVVGFFEEEDRKNEQEGRFYFDPEEMTPQIIWPIQSCFAVAHSDEEISIQQYTSIPPKLARGYVSLFSPYMVRMDIAQTVSGELFTAAGIMALLGGKWRDCLKNGGWTSGGIPIRYHDGGPDGHQVKTSMSLALNQRYEWGVSLGVDGCPTIRFQTDPTGIKELFKLREVSEGKDRRDILLNWVTDHWRQNRQDDDVEIYVRKHLRGNVKFDWNGLYGEILPSRFDVDKRDEFLRNREAMRTAGEDRREKIK